MTHSGSAAPSASAEPAGSSTYSPAMAEAHHYIRWVLSRFEGHLHGRLLEVGLGHGSFYPQLAPRGRYVGIDIDPEVVADARRRFPEGRFVQGDVTSPDWVLGLGDAAPDAILCFNVLEHISDDRAAARGLLEALRPGGRLLLGVPAWPALFNDLDRLAGHRRRYRVRDVRALIPADLAEVVRLEYFNPIGGLGWWANGLLRHRSLGAPAVSRQVRAFDRYVIPWSRLLDPFTRRFFGQSVMCVARRRGGA